MKFNWTSEIVARLAGLTVYGGLLHLLDIPIRQMTNEKVRRLSRYGAGIIGGLPAFLTTIEILLDVAQVATEPAARRRLLWISACAYVLAFVPLGIGVVISYFLEQILAE